MILTWHKRDENNRRYKVLSIHERDILQCLVRTQTYHGDVLQIMSFDLPEHTELVGLYDNAMMACKDLVLFNPAWPILSEAQIPERIKADYKAVMVDQRLENPDPCHIVSRIMAMRNAPAPQEKDPSYDHINIPDPWRPGKVICIRKNLYVHMLNGAGIQSPSGFFTDREILDQYLMTPHTLTKFEKPLTVENGSSLRVGQFTAQVIGADGQIKAETRLLNPIVSAQEAEFMNPALGEPHKEKKTAEELDPFKKSWRDEPSFLGGISGG